MDYLNRRASLKEAITGLDLDSLILTDPASIYYISGFRGSSSTVLADKCNPFVLITDFRYADATLNHQASDFHVIISNSAKNAELAKIVYDRKHRRVGFESMHLSYSKYEILREKLTGLELVPVRDLLEKQRIIKDEDETAAIKAAVEIAQYALSSVMPIIKPGVSENEIAALYEYEARKAGSEGTPFPTIVAFGDHSAIPHAVPTDRIARAGDIVKIDCGATRYGYCSDMTRTFFLGQADLRLSEAYLTTLKALDAALKMIRPGVLLSEIDAAARQVINSSAFAGTFTHGVGHGIGIEVHEQPGIDKNSVETTAAGMIFTVEPGIYLKGIGGMRIEEVVKVNDDGCELLTSFAKDLIILMEGCA